MAPPIRTTVARAARAPRARRACRRPWRRRGSRAAGARLAHAARGARARARSRAPAAARGSRRATPDGRGVRAVRGAEGVVHVDVGERRERRAKSGSFSSSPAWKRRFSSSSSSPGRELGDRARPRVADAVRQKRDTAGPSSSARRSAHGPQRERRARACPSAARGASRATTPRPASSRRRSVGSEARMRESSAIAPVLERHVQVGAHEARARRASRPPGRRSRGGGSAIAYEGRTRRPGRPPGTSSPTRCRTRRAP